MPAQGLVHLPLTHLAVPKLHRLVTVAFQRFHLGDRAGAGLHHRDRDDAPVLGEDLGHAQLSSYDSLQLSHLTTALPRPWPHGALVSSVRLQLDLDIHPRWKVQPHQGIHRLGGWLQDIDEALVHPHLEMLP